MIRLRILIYLDTPLTILFFILLNMLVLFSSLHMSEINYLPKPANASFSSIPLHIKNIGVMILLPNDFVLPAMYHFFFLKMFHIINLITSQIYLSSTPPLQRLPSIMFLHTHLLYLLLPHRYLFHSLSLPLRNLFHSLSLPLRMRMLLLLMLHCLCLLRFSRVISLLLAEIHHATITLLPGIVPLLTQHILLSFYHLFIPYILYWNLSLILRL